MTASNAEQIEYWNGKVGERWAAFQETLDAAMADITAAALAFADARPGERALDVGCGCGTTALRLAAATGAPVTGVDISAPMLAVARKRAPALTFIEADASVHGFDPSFDLVFSRFGVMFFADPAGAFANIRTALKPGGRLRFVCWRTAPENAWAAATFAAVKDLLPPQPPADPTAPGPFAFGDGERLKGILGRAGFRNARLEKLDTAMNMGASLDAAIDQAFKIGPTARALAEVDDATKAVARRRIGEALARFLGPRGVTPPAACWLAAGET